MIKIEPDSSNGLSKDSAADCFQVRSVSKDRFVRKIGQVPDIVLDDIKKGLSKVLSID